MVHDFIEYASNQYFYFSLIFQVAHLIPIALVNDQPAKTESVLIKVGNTNWFTLYFPSNITNQWISQFMNVWHNNFTIRIDNPHQKIEAGKTCFHKDLDYLRTAKECEWAAKTFDIPYGGHFSGDNNPSCVYRDSDKKIYFNRNSRARCLKDRCKSKMDSNHAAICKGIENFNYNYASVTQNSA